MVENITMHRSTEGLYIYIPAPFGARVYTDDQNAVFRTDVQCFVKSLAYDFQAKTGYLVCDLGGCTDMRGAISLFKTIDPAVGTIITLSDGVKDTLYRLVDGKWQAFFPKEPSHG